MNTIIIFDPLNLGAVRSTLRGLTRSCCIRNLLQVRSSIALEGHIDEHDPFDLEEVVAYIREGRGGFRRCVGHVLEVDAVRHYWEIEYA
jgi:hypothetical protein